MTRGGKREGAGRPAGSTKDDNKVMLSIRIDRKLMAWLKRQANQARTIEDALRLYRDNKNR